MLDVGIMGVKRSEAMDLSDFTLRFKKSEFQKQKSWKFFYTYLLLPDLCSSSFDSGSKHQHLADPVTKVHMQFEGTRP